MRPFRLGQTGTHRDDGGSIYQVFQIRFIHNPQRHQFRSGTNDCGNMGFKRGNGHQPGAGTQGGFSGESRRARHAGASADNKYVTTETLMRIAGSFRKTLPDEARPEPSDASPIDVEYLLRGAQRVEHQIAGERRTAAR